MQHLNKIHKEEKRLKRLSRNPTESSNLFPENLIFTLCNSWQPLLGDVRKEPEPEEKLSK